MATSAVEIAEAVGKVAAPETKEEKNEENTISVPVQTKNVIPKEPTVKESKIEESPETAGAEVKVPISNGEKEPESSNITIANEGHVEADTQELVDSTPGPDKVAESVDSKVEEPEAEDIKTVQPEENKVESTQGASNLESNTETPEKETLENIKPGEEVKQEATESVVQGDNTPTEPVTEIVTPVQEKNSDHVKAPITEEKNSVVSQTKAVIPETHATEAAISMEVPVVHEAEPVHEHITSKIESSVEQPSSIAEVFPSTMDITEPVKLEESDKESSKETATVQDVPDADGTETVAAVEIKAPVEAKAPIIEGQDAPVAEENKISEPESVIESTPAEETLVNTEKETAIPTEATAPTIQEQENPKLEPVKECPIETEQIYIIENEAEAPNTENIVAPASVEKQTSESEHLGETPITERPLVSAGKDNLSVIEPETQAVNSSIPRVDEEDILEPLKEDHIEPESTPGPEEKQVVDTQLLEEMPVVEDSYVEADKEVPIPVEPVEHEISNEDESVPESQEERILDPVQGHIKLEAEIEEDSITKPEEKKISEPVKEDYVEPKITPIVNEHPEESAVIDRHIEPEANTETVMPEETTETISREIQPEVAVANEEIRAQNDVPENKVEEVPVIEKKAEKETEKATKAHDPPTPVIEVAFVPDTSEPESAPVEECTTDTKETLPKKGGDESVIDVVEGKAVDADGTPCAVIEEDLITKEGEQKPVTSVVEDKQLVEQENIKESESEVTRKGSTPPEVESLEKTIEETTVPKNLESEVKDSSTTVLEESIPKQSEPDVQSQQSESPAKVESLKEESEETQMVEKGEKQVTESKEIPVPDDEEILTKASQSELQAQQAIPVEVENIEEKTEGTPTAAKEEVEDAQIEKSTSSLSEEQLVTKESKPQVQLEEQESSKMESPEEKVEDTPMAAKEEESASSEELPILESESKVPQEETEEFAVVKNVSRSTPSDNLSVTEPVHTEEVVPQILREQIPVANEETMIEKTTDPVSTTPEQEDPIAEDSKDTVEIPAVVVAAETIESQDSKAKESAETSESDVDQALSVSQLPIAKEEEERISEDIVDGPEAEALPVSEKHIVEEKEPISKDVAEESKTKVLPVESEASGPNLDETVLPEQETNVESTPTPIEPGVEAERLPIESEVSIPKLDADILPIEKTEIDSIAIPTESQVSQEQPIHSASIPEVETLAIHDTPEKPIEFSEPITESSPQEKPVESEENATVEQTHASIESNQTSVIPEPETTPEVILTEPTPIEASAKAEEQVEPSPVVEGIKPVKTESVHVPEVQAPIFPDEVEKPKEITLEPVADSVKIKSAPKPEVVEEAQQTSSHPIVETETETAPIDTESTAVTQEAFVPMVEEQSKDILSDPVVEDVKADITPIEEPIFPSVIEEPIFSNTTEETEDPFSKDVSTPAEDKTKELKSEEPNASLSEEVQAPQNAVPEPVVEPIKAEEPVAADQSDPVVTAKSDTESVVAQESEPVDSKEQDSVIETSEPIAAEQSEPAVASEPIASTPVEPETNPTPESPKPIDTTTKTVEPTSPVSPKSAKRSSVWRYLWPFGGSSKSAEKGDKTPKSPVA